MNVLNRSTSAKKKVLKANKKDGYGNLARKVSAIQPFSIRTNFRGSEKKTGMKKPVLLRVG